LVGHFDTTLNLEVVITWLLSPVGYWEEPFSLRQIDEGK
jgi:hypothetical protein